MLQAATLVSRRLSARIALLLASAGVVVCTAIALPSAAGGHTVAAGTTSAKMTTVLDTVKPDSIKADLTFIASDDMQGRDTPSAGLQIAANFIRARLQRLGWQPGASDGYFYKFKLDRRVLDEAATSVSYKVDGRPETLKFGRDYFLPSSFDVRESTLEAPIVFAGKGTTDDFDAKVFEGKIALCFDGGDDVREYTKRARKAKCVGVIVAPGPEYKGESYAERFAPVLERQRKGSVRFPEKADAKKPDANKPDDKKSDDGKSDDKKKAAPREEFSTLIFTQDAVSQMLASVKQPPSPKAGTALGLTLSDVRKLDNGGNLEVQNVCGFWPGSDPELAKEVIIVSAHYDHVGVQNGVVYNGADDNGSGTCGMMAVAEALTNYGPMRRSVMLMWLAGEEKGLWGSRAWNDNPWLPEGCHAVADVNIDMIGRNAPDKLLITPTSKLKKQYNALVEVAESFCASEGFPELGSADDYYERSDHYNFAKAGIPAAFLFSDVHADYHKPTDDVDKIDFDKIRRVVRLVLRMLDGLQTDKLALK
jgi:hypothetical protein